MYDTDVVPVGLDQKQHVEYARDTAEKFNRIFGDTFKIPEPLILDSSKTVPGIDGRKMSKSYSNTIPLFATDDEIKKLVMSIVTDSNTGIPQNVYATHSLLHDKNLLDAIYNKKRGKYKELKDKLIEDITALISPLRARRGTLAKDKTLVQNMLSQRSRESKGCRAKKNEACP